MLRITSVVIDRWPWVTPDRQGTWKGREVLWTFEESLPELKVPHQSGFSTQEFPEIWKD